MTVIEESPLVAHAKQEMQLAGLYDEDADYDGMVAEAVEEIVEVFSRQGHSGMSAAIVTSIVERLLRFETLTPITSDPATWMHVGDDSRGQVYQSRRNPAVFSYDGGQTWHNINED